MRGHFYLFGFEIEGYMPSFEDIFSTMHKGIDRRMEARRENKGDTRRTDNIKKKRERDVKINAREEKIGEKERCLQDSEMMRENRFCIREK